MFTDIASPTVPCDQPNSWCSGFIITPGIERKPAAPRIATKLTAATTQAQWMRLGLRVGLGMATRPLCLTDGDPASGINASIHQKHATIGCAPRGCSVAGAGGRLRRGDRKSVV